MTFDAGSISARLGLDMSGFDKSLGQLDKKAAALSNGVAGLSKKTSSLSGDFKTGALQAVGFGSAVGVSAVAIHKLTQGVRDSISEFTKFEATMTTVETLVGVAHEEVVKFQGDVERLAEQTGRGPQELAEALFFVTSAGLRGSNALDVLTQSAKAAEIGLGATKDVADAATSILNAYGTQNVSAAEAIGTLIKTVREGKLAPEELASSLGQAIPLSAQLGVSIEEVGGAIASLTRIGNSAAESVTQLSGIMSVFIKPTDKSEKILAKFGLTTAEVRRQIADEGLIPVLQELRNTMGEELFAQFLKRIEAVRGSLALTGSRFDETGQIIESVKDNLGVMNEAMEQTEKTAADKAAKIAAAWANMKKSTGKDLTDLGFTLVNFFSPEDTASRFEKLSAVVRGVFAHGDIALEGRSLARELGILDEHGVMAKDAMEKLRAELDRMGVSGKTADDVILDLTRTMDKAVPPMEGLKDKAVETADEIKKRFMETGEIVPPGLSESAKRAFDEQAEALLKAQEAAEKYAAAVKDIADELGGSNLAREAKQIEDAIQSLGGAGELSTGAMESLASKIEDLERHTIPVPPELAKVRDRLKEIDEIAKSLVPNLARVNFVDVIPVENQAGNRFGDLKPLVPGAKTNAGETIKAAMDRAKEAQDAYNSSLSQTADLMQALGPLADTTIGHMIAELMNARSAAVGLGASFEMMSAGLEAGNFDTFLQGLTTGIGSVMQAYSAFMSATDRKGIMGILGGAQVGAQIGGQLFGPIGAAIGAGAGALAAGLRKLFGGGPDIVGDVARDLGKSITQELADEIEKTGKPIQLSLARIFEAGAFGDDIDRFAEEIGDIFSGLMREEFSQSDAVEALGQSVADLLPNVQQLGEQGVLQLERIFAAAAATGTQFAGMDELAKAYVARARELGIAVNDVVLGALGLQEALANPTAPKTIEEIAKQFDLTNDQVRELGGLMDVQVQTNLERMAANANLSVDQFREMAEILKRDMGVELEEIGPLLESMGGDARALAESLGVNLGDGADALGEGAAGAKDELQAGAEWSKIIADEAERAALAYGSIHFGGSGSPGGGNVPTTHAQHGVAGTFRGPHRFEIEPGITEDVFIGPAGSLGQGSVGTAGGTTKFEITVNLAGVAVGDKEVADRIEGAVRLLLEDNRLQDAIKR